MRSILFAILLGSFLLLNVSAGVAQTLTQDSLALVALYNGTNGPNWTNKTNWLTGRIATWYGVTVSGGRVNGLNLTSNNLIGATPASFGNLTGLTTLDLPDNQLTSVDISNMPALVRCYLQQNPNLATVTKNNTVGYYPNINWVALEGCSLSAFNTRGMEAVERLTLDNNQLTTLDISQLSRLSELSAYNNQLTQLITSTSANYYRQLIGFSVADNQLISVDISNMPALVACSLSSNSNLTTVTKNNTVGYYPNLYEVSLSNCRLSAFNMTGMESVFMLGLSNNQLITLDISQLFRVWMISVNNNRLTQLITNTSANYYSRLNHFQASSNQLTSVDISNMPALGSLNLQDNPNLATLTKNNTAGYYPNIRDLALNNCKLSALNTRGMESVYDLQLGYNQLTTLDISQLSSLSYLSASNNQLTQLITNPSANYYNQVYLLEIQNNKLTFEDVEPLVVPPTINGSRQYSPQAEVQASYDAQTRTLSVQVGGTANRYQWKKNGVNIPGATSTTLVITQADYQANGQYQCVITSTIATALTLYSQLLRPGGNEIPVIYSIAPSAAPLGTVITIIGKGFDALPANNVVYFGAVKAGVLTASPTQLTVPVPAGATSVVPVTVTNLSSALGASSLTATSSPVMFNLTFQSLADLRYAYGRSDVSLSTNSLNAVAGDVNGDNLVDLVVTNYDEYNSTASTLSVFLRSTSNAGFGPAIQYGVGVQPRGIAIADYNGDGKQDIAISNQGSHNVSVLIRKSDNTGFEPVATLAVGSSPSSIAAGDINGDGRIDLVTTSQPNNAVSILLRKGDNSGFEPAVSVGASNQPHDVALGDFNGDGRTDMAVTNSTGMPAISILVRRADNTGFEPLASFPLTAAPYELVVGDFNNDGKIDIAASIYPFNTVALLYRKGDNTGFEAAQYLPVSVSPSIPYGITVGDFNGDGKADIATAASQSNSVSVLLRKGDNTGFEPGVTLAASAGMTPSSVNTGDFNKDGKADLITAYAYSNTVSIFTYQPIVANPSYTICAGESVTLQAQAAGTIRWYDAATGGNVLHTGANFTVTPLSTRQYWVDAQESGFFSSRKEVTVTVNSAPWAFITTPGRLIFCIGETVFVNITTMGGNFFSAYQWQKDGVNVAGATGPNYTATTRGSYRLKITNTSGCTAYSNTLTITEQPALTATLIRLRGVSCAITTDAQLQLGTNATSGSYVLYQNNTGGSPVTFSGSTVSFNNLGSGAYRVVLTNAQGCVQTSNTLTLEEGGPVATVCPVQLPCEGTTQAVVYFNLSYPDPPANFSGRYQYRVLKNNAEVIPSKLATPNNPTGTDPLYGNPGAVYAFREAIPNAQAGDQITIEVTAYIPGTAGCNCFVPVCTKNTSFAFERAEPTLALDATGRVDGTPVYYVCQANASASVGITFSKTLFNCSAPFNGGYSLTLKPANGPLQVLAQSGQTTSSVQIQQTLSLLPGKYQLVGELGPGNYRCRKTVDFEVISLGNLSVSVRTTGADCQGGTAAAVVSGGMGQLSYRWLRTNAAGQVLETLSDKGSAYSASQVSGLRAGNYRLEASLLGSGASCVIPVPFVIDSLVGATRPLVSGRVCDGVARAKALNIRGHYRFDWYGYTDSTRALRKDSLLFSEFVRPLANDSLLSQLGELAADSAWYYVVMTDPQGCALTSLPVKLLKPRFDRTYRFCLQWGVPAPRPQPDQPSSVQTLASLTASNVRQTLEEKVSGCLTIQQKLVEQKLNVACLEPGAVSDTLWLNYPQRYHHFTLYYYDRAGSLVKTVPPAGVNPQPGAVSRLSRPAHELATTYQYNSLGQLMRQVTPDADTTNFVYNRSGQLRFSQNARQRADGTYSYTKYDELSRVAEVGQASAVNPAQSPVFNALTAHLPNETLLTADTTRTLLTTQRFPLAGVSSLGEQTVTVYSEPKNNVSYFGLSRQRNLQNRVSYTYTYNRADSSRAVYTYYSYDPHGNVEWMVQEIPGLPRNYLAYEYDLISGKVLQVKYNEHRNDRFFHRYHYDEDNRLTQVETSPDGYAWDRDAQYEYYRHGPLKRTGLGEDKVQGLDFVYTIQGWLKGINAPVSSGAASDTLDLGRDGIRAGNPYSRDVFGMALHYYKGDFRHSNSAFHSPSVINTANTAANRFNLPPTQDLYNGNISGWVTNTSGSNAGNRMIEGNQFGYDRLNRLKSSGRQRWNPATQAWRPLSDTLRTHYSYDGSGNLLSLNRRDDKGARLDSLVYTYETLNGRKSNRLRQVTDRIGTTAYPDDLEGTSVYTYDPIGNLILDQKEGVAIDWNVYGKVSQVRPSDTTSKKPYVRYLYDAAGNRVAKEVKPSASPGTSLPGEAKVKTTYYARDAQGNTMAVYERTVAQQAAGADSYRLTVRQAEVPIYGSDRLGMFVPDSTFLVNNLYTKAQLDSGVTLPATHYQRRTENSRMLTAGNRSKAITDSLSQTLTLAWAKRMPIRANLWRVDTVGISPFAGRTGSNLALGETLAGQPEVYAVTAADYWGAAHTTLVSDTTGKLLVNSDSIRADARAKSLLVRRPGQTGQYFLVTTDTTGALLLHTVDARAGKVSGKNRVLGSSGYRYGRQLTALEDRSTGQVYLYATRHKNGTSELVVLTLDSLGQQAQQTLASEAGVDEQGEGELQLSPDGKQLVWYQLGNRLGWFSHRQMQPKVYSLSEDHLTLSKRKALTLTNGEQETDLASLDFDQTSQTVSYSQRGLATTATWQVTLASNALSQANVNAGELRRGQDGIIHLEAGGLPVQVHTLLAPDLSTAKAGIAYRSVGQKQYELQDHLGNVRVTVGDEKLATITPQGSGLGMELRAAVRSYFHYYPFGMNQPGGVYEGDTLRRYRFGYQGQEKDNEIKGEGTNYDFGARMLDPRIGRWFAVDPLAEKMPAWSPYSFCFNSAIKFIDPDGQEPTPYEAALMAAHVYGDSKLGLAGGWKVSSAAKNMVLSNPSSGFKSVLYERTTIDGKTEYTYATAGTEKSWKDVIADIKQPLGLSTQYKESMKKATDLKNILPEGVELTFTGHSLGGGLAELNSMTTGDKAITFNAAGVSILTSRMFKKSNTLAIIMSTDPLNAFQQASVTLVPTAGGRKQLIAPRSLSGWYNGHSIYSIVESLKIIQDGGDYKVIEILSKKWSDLINKD